MLIVQERIETKKMEMIYYVDSVGNSRDKKMEMIYYADSVGKDRDKKDGDDLR